ncbi:MAG: MgtC/SapB family protein [Aequorivita sp.]
MEKLEFLLRLCTAIFAGICIGVERQWHHKSTGLKTTMLVATGAAIFVLLSIQYAASSKVDVTRIIAQVVTGVGFLGAGIIFREGANIHGLSSAATIWCSAAIGCVAASGYFLETFICTALIIILNITLEPLEKWLKNRK